MRSGPQDFGGAAVFGRRHPDIGGEEAGETALGGEAEIELDSIARASGLSRPHFYRLFRTQTGVTPNLYLNTLIMEQALDALVATEVPIADIGFDLGFSSQSGFTRFFAANVGMAPTEYRRAAKVLRP